MRKTLFFCAVLLVVSLLAAPAALAQDKKCNAIPWGEPISAVEQLEFSHTAGGIRYYKVKKVESCGISKIEDTRVTYAFRENKLYATIIEIDKARDVKHVISILMDEYGLPDHHKSGSWDVYEWENDKLKIKLKSEYLTDRIKIGMYYKPLIPKE
ncbi:hypothetical protein [Pseudodesulfovibrio sp.]|uniref:hypothetical protein n=1 Tax=unclassified Pseudodesulfovibrio TaxID=2661612 RepID=UPI003B005DE5